MDITTLYFIRHGQSVANLDNYCACQLDVPLTQLGQQQASCTADFLRDVPFSAVYASDLSRAYDTGAAIALLHGLVVVPREDLREIGGGAWEGLPYTEVEKRYAQDYHRWMTHIGLACPTNGESVAALQRRMQIAVADIVAAHPNETVCIATHATAIRVLECMWTDTSLEDMNDVPWVSNASVTVAEYDTPAAIGRLIVHDMNEHLKELSTKFPSNI